MLAERITHIRVYLAHGQVQDGGLRQNRGFQEHALSSLAYLAVLFLASCFISACAETTDEPDSVDSDAGMTWQRTVSPPYLPDAVESSVEVQDEERPNVTVRFSDRVDDTVSVENTEMQDGEGAITPLEESDAIQERIEDTTGQTSFDSGFASDTADSSIPEQEGDGTTPGSEGGAEDTFLANVEDAQEEVSDTASNDAPDCSEINCGMYAFCVESDNGPNCECDFGFTSSPAGCEDIDECQDSPCGANQQCLNQPGTYSCANCPEGMILSDGACAVGYNLCGIGASQDRVGGSWDLPIQAPYLPMVDENNTATNGVSLANSYDCAPDTNESGPEIVYKFTIPHPGYFRADVECIPEANGGNCNSAVDIDLHLLENPVIENGVAKGCIERGHKFIEVDTLGAGTYTLTADSFVGNAGVYSGSYRVAFEWIPDNTWTEIPVTDEIIWRRVRTSEWTGTQQTVQELEVSMGGALALEASLHNGCTTVEQQAKSLNALVGVNGGFFAPGCVPLDMIKTAGDLLSVNEMSGFEQPTLGWNSDHILNFKWVAPNADWSEVSNAIGGYPGLVEEGNPFAAVYPGEQVWSAVDWSDHPRTAVGYTDDNRLLMWTFDGRTKMGEGLKTFDLAQILANRSASFAFGLDGGGSTTMFINDCSINGIVNFPSDNKASDHKGMRSVSDGLYVY